MIAGGIGAGVLIAVVAVFAIVGHGRTAARASAAGNVAVAAAPVMQTAAAEPVYHETTTHHAVRKPGVKPEPNPSATPTPGATPTPSPTNTPPADHAAAVSGLSPAKAKHEAALRLAALRRLEASQSAGSGNTVAQATSAQPAPVSPNSGAASTPAQAQPAAATPAADATPLYAPRVVVDARFIDRVSPTYPDIAKEQGASGTAIVPDAELHLSTPLNHRGLGSTPIGFPDILDFTGGFYFFFRRAVLGVAAGAPLTGPKPYDFEVNTNLNFRF